MTLAQLDQIVEYLLHVALPPHVASDPPLAISAVLDVLEKHCEVLRGRLILAREERNWDELGK